LKVAEETFDLETALLAPRSKQGIEALASWVDGDPNRFDQAWSIMQSEPGRPSELAAWLVDRCLVRWPTLMIPYQFAAFEMLFISYHQAVHRCLTKHLAGIPIDESLQMPLLDFCFSLIVNDRKPIASRANCISIAWRIVSPSPEQREMLADLLATFDRDPSPAIRSRTRNVLAKIRKAG